MTKNNQKDNKKISNSAVRILELLKILSARSISSHEFFRMIEEKGDIVFKKEMLWKYINTLKLFGFNITKNKEKYHMDNVLETTNYNEQDLSTLKFIEEYTKQANLKTIESDINSILTKIEKTFSPETINRLISNNIKSYSLNINSKINNCDIQKFEKYCKDGLKLNITYKISENEEKTFKLSPLRIVYKKHKAVLIAFDVINNEYKEFWIEYISNVEQTPQKASNNYSSAVIFKLKGRLAKAYVLKQDEKLEEYGPDFIIVSNSKEDKSILLRRLIRYYDKCEIIYPKEIRNQMIELINNIERIYERK